MNPELSPMARHTAFVLLAALVLGGSTGASAQQSSGSMRPAARPVFTPPAKTVLVCFWKYDTGAPFGASGTCPVAQMARIDGNCSCVISAGNQPPHRQAGRVIAKPVGGPLPVVR
jgi:hypothetical protein